jgi:DNA mismatch endonuclease, patch repair protein
MVVVKKGHKRSIKAVSYNMSRIHSKGTGLEAKLETILEKISVPFVKHPKMYGNPDFGYPELKVTVFADSDFWHGYDWENKKKELRRNRSFWLRKLEGNIRRDLEVTERLQSEGWQVVRLWGHDIIRQPNKCREIIEQAVNAAKAADKSKTSKNQEEAIL